MYYSSAPRVTRTVIVRQKNTALTMYVRHHDPRCWTLLTTILRASTFSRALGLPGVLVAIRMRFRHASGHQGSLSMNLRLTFVAAHGSYHDQNFKAVVSLSSISVSIHSISIQAISARFWSPSRSHSFPKRATAS
jgi:hypothetical protein